MYLENLIHPFSELRFVSAAIGYGLFATRPIPKGTITWVRDPLDQVISAARIEELPELLRLQTHKYCYLNGGGERVAVVGIMGAS